MKKCYFIFPYLGGIRTSGWGSVIFQKGGKKSSHSEEMLEQDCTRGGKRKQRPEGEHI
jgi:hypothetical protein